MPFADYANFEDCVRQNPQADDPDAYCGSIQAGTENKAARQHGKDIYGKRPGATGPGPAHVHPHKTGPTSIQKAVTAASITHQAVRNALLSVVAKRDPVKEEGDKKLKEADGVAADGAQDDQAFAVAWGVDNYDKLTKDILVLPYRKAYQAAGAIVKALERKAMNFPGDLEDHLKKAHAAIHGREMWDARYGNVCKLLKQARKLLHDIEKTAEVAAQGGDMPQVVGKADPIDKAGPELPPPGMQPGSKKSYALKAPVKKIGTGTRGAYDRFPPTPKKQPKVPQSKLQTPRQAARTKQTFAREQWGGKALKASVRKAVAAAGR